VASEVSTINTATITHSDQFDPNPANNTATTATVPLQADLFVTKTVNDSTANVGDTIAYTVTVGDNGPDNATGVALQDLLPAGLTLVTSLPGQGTYDPSTGIWTVGDVADGSSAVLTIHALVVSPDPTTNTATITAADQFDPNPGNNTATTVVTPQQADVVLSKTVNDPTPNVGDTITYTVTARDAGPDTATGVVVQDLLPAGLTFVSATPSQGTFDSASGIWTIGTVTTSTAQTLAIRATVASPNRSTNTATIAHADQFDPDTANNTARVDVTPQQADLALSKTVSDSTPNVGDTISYTVTLTDNGPDDATGVQVTDLLPFGVSFVSATPSQGVYSSSTGVWTVGAVTTSVPQTLTLTGIVDSPNRVTNTATITRANQFDPNPGNNTATTVVTPQHADLALSNTVNDPTPNVGDTITYTITLTDNGPGAATNAQVTDLLPTGLTFVSDTTSQGTYDPSTGVWAVGTVTTTTAQTLEIQAKVASSNPQTNTATISHSDQFDPNTANNSASATETPQQADLELSKTVSDSTPNVGDTITYTVILSNDGPDSATNVTVEDLLPAGLTFVSDVPSQGTYDSSTGIWTVGTVTTTATQTLLIRAMVVSPAAQTNTASISRSDQFDPNIGNNSAAATETPQQADLAVRKTVSNPTPNVGDTITYTITLTDNGPDPATGLTVQDTLPAGVMFVSATPSEGSYDSSTGVWTVGGVDTTTPQTLLITAKVQSANPAANTASISHTDQFDPDTANNSDTASTNPLEADLALTKTVNDPTPNVGDTITYTVTLTDSGPADATGVEVTDLLPSGLSFVAANPSQGSYDAATGLWTVGSVADLAQATLTLQAKVVSPDAEINTATISHSDQSDPNPGNNTASSTETPQQADLGLTKTVDDATPNVGDTITFTATLADLGPDRATNVTVQDLLPSGLTFVSATPSQGTYDSSTSAWAVGTVTTATAQTLQIEARVASPDPRTNTATVSHSDQFDPDTTNNSASASETPQQADLAITKTVSNPTPNVGDTITYTVTAINRGPDAATGVTINELVPAGLSFVSAFMSAGSYDDATGIWSVGTLSDGDSAALTIAARVVSATAQTNTASVSHSNQFDPNTGNDTASTTEIPERADLALTKTVDDPTPNVGDTVTFAVTLADHGSDPATNVTVQDLLPAGLTFVSATPSQGNYDSASGAWTVGTVSRTATPTLLIRALVASAAAQTNTASISHSDQFDPNAGNNSAAATETPQHADLELSKIVNDSTPKVDDTITYTVTLKDNGPSSATAVAVTDKLPAGLTFVSATPSQGTYDSNTGLWSVGTVSDGSSLTLIIEADAQSPGIHVNVATIAQSNQYDPNPNNNTSSVSVDVSPSTPPVTVVSLRRFGFHEQPTMLVVAFSGVLDTPSAQDLSNYSLVLIAHGGALHLRVPIFQAAYDPTANTVSLRPTRLLPLRFHYVLTINASIPTGVRAANGELLDGNDDGIPGGNYVQQFGRNILSGRSTPFFGRRVGLAQSASWR
jgi:uncharacterized repeat protein (TIGR01451 family)